MDKDNETPSARSSKSQSSVEEVDDKIRTDRSTKDSTTKDLDKKDRTNKNDETRGQNAEPRDNDKDGETSVNSWHETDNVARGSRTVGHDQEKGDEDSTGKMNNKKEFLWKIHELLEEVSEQDKEHVVSWSPRGTSFKVHNPEAFVNEVMPRYSTATQFRSFEKMLNLYDFKKIKGGPLRGGYQHPLFRRDDRELCKKIKMRPKPKRLNKESRGSLGGRKSQVEDNFVGGLDQNFLQQRGSALQEEDGDQHLSSIDEISMGYFQQMTTTTRPTNIGGVSPNLQSHDRESLIQLLENQQAHEGVHTSNLYQNILDLSTSYHLSSIIGGTGSSGNRMLMDDATTSSSATTNQQQFIMFDPTIIPALPTSTTGSTPSAGVPLHLSDSRFDHVAAPSAGNAGYFLDSPTAMVGSVGFGVVGGQIMQSFPELMSVPPAAGHALSNAGTTIMTTRSTTPSNPPPLSETRINPMSLDPPMYSHFLDLGGTAVGTSRSGNIFVHASSTQQEPPAQQGQQQLYASTMVASSDMRSSSSSSFLSFDPTMMIAKQHQEEDQKQECGDHCKVEEAERIIFAEPLSDDLEPTHLPPPI